MEQVSKVASAKGGGQPINFPIFQSSKDEKATSSQVSMKGRQVKTDKTLTNAVA